MNASTKKRRAPVQHYSNERFDRIQAMALQLADEQRRLLGREYPEYGYSYDDWARAEEIYERETTRG
jgi:hypothetical protein